MPPVDLMRVRPERDHADLPALIVEDIEPDAPGIMAAADFEMSGEFLFGDQVEFGALWGWVHVHARCCHVNGLTGKSSGQTAQSASYSAAYSVGSGSRLTSRWQLLSMS